MEVTPLAVEKLKEVIDQEGEAGSSLRVVAMPSDQGGLQYMLTMEKESQPDDTVPVSYTHLTLPTTSYV